MLSVKSRNLDGGFTTRLEHSLPLCYIEATATPENGLETSDGMHLSTSPMQPEIDLSDSTSDDDGDSYDELDMNELT